MLRMDTFHVASILCITTHFTFTSALPQNVSNFLDSPPQLGVAKDSTLSATVFNIVSILVAFGSFGVGIIAVLQVRSRWRSASPGSVKLVCSMANISDALQSLQVPASIGNSTSVAPCIAAIPSHVFDSGEKTMSSDQIHQCSIVTKVPTRPSRALLQGEAFCLGIVCTTWTLTTRSTTI